MDDTLMSLFSLTNEMDNNLVPDDDLKDMHDGAKYIPDKVTKLRRKGETIIYDKKRNIWITDTGEEIE
jgi:hypothetical protein